MLVKKIALIGLFSMSMSLPLFAQASDLTTTNCTKADSTAVINGATCSRWLPGGVGITPPDCKPHNVSESIVNNICKFTGDPENCVADIYNTSDCSGAVIATVHFSITTGIDPQKTQVYDTRYTLDGTGFNITLSGGPAATLNTKN